MATGYSSGTVIAAKSLQIFTYMYTSMVTFWSYDYACSLNEEWTFLLKSRWTTVKVLYIVTRYVPFLLFVAHLYMNFTNETPHKCQVMDIISESISLISVICSECFFIFRTYALWNHNKIVLAAMLFSFPAIIISSVGVLFATNVHRPFYTSGISGITGCYQPSSAQLFTPFMLLSALQLGLLVLTLIRAIQNWRTINGPLSTVLLTHNIEYYVCGLLFSVLNIFASLFLYDAYSTMFYNFQVIILTIMATRMHLYLWHTERHLRSPDAPLFIPMTNVIFHLEGGSGHRPWSDVHTVGLGW